MALPIYAPALTRREVALAVADERQGRHWLDADCWCGARHNGAEAGLTFTAAAWDESRAREVAE